MEPKISIITPSLNSAKYIENAIKSVLEQNYQNIEHIIMDGGSSDGTLRILKKYSHLKWVSEADSGQSNAMNKGFLISTGEIIGYLNSDDYYLPGAFSAILPYFENKEKFVVGNIKVVMDDGSFWINNARIGHEDMLKHWEPEAFCVNSVGYFYHREVQEKVGGFNECNHFAMDLEFLLSASKYFKFHKIDSLLGVFRYITGTVTSQSQKSENVWTKKNFQFIDRFLNGMPEDFIIDFEKKREQGYLLRKNWQAHEKNKEKNYQKRFNGKTKCSWIRYVIEKAKKLKILS